MTNWNRTGNAIPSNSSFPYGEEKCTILDGLKWDGVACDGSAVYADADGFIHDSIADNVVSGSVVVGNCLGIAVYDKELKDANGVKVVKGTAPASGSSARTCIDGIVVARCSFSANDNIAGGGMLSVGDTGLLIKGADETTSTVANLVDLRAKDNDANEEHVVYFRGRQANKHD